MDQKEQDPAIVSNSPKIPGYTILSQLGEGGMATVYLAIQESFGRKVALKAMMPKAQEDSTYGERFIREAKIVARLSHPNIVPVYDVGVAGDYHYISMEYLNGGDLTRRIRGKLKLSEVIKITKEVALALEYAHKKGYVHRDVKPDNIMFREDGAAVLTDFGIARPAAPDTNMTQVGKVIGTPKYMSPEQTKGEEIDNTCDLYALGIMFYEMLTGNVPFDGKDPFEIGIKHLKDPIPRLPKELTIFQPLLDGLLTKNKFKRTQSGRDVVEALDQIMQSAGKRQPARKPAQQESFSPSFSTEKTQVRDASGEQIMRANTMDREIALPDQRPKQSSAGLIILSVVLLFCMAFSAIWFSPQFAPNTILHQWNKSLIALLTPEPPPPPKPKVNPIELKVRASLREAQVALALGNYVTPFGESALDHYRAALTLDGDNTEAKLGIADIATRLVSQANEAIAAKDFAKAHELLTQAKAISPNIPGLITAEAALRDAEAAYAADSEAARLAEQQRAAEAARLAKEKAAAEAAERRRLARIKKLEEEERLRQEELARQKAQAEKANALFNSVRIKGLLAKADTYYSRGDYHSPLEENALDKYLEVLAIDGANISAKTGIERVVTVMIPEIEGLLTQQNVEQAKHLYDRAIQASPDNTALKNLGQSKGW